MDLIIPPPEITKKQVQIISICTKKQIQDIGLEILLKAGLDTLSIFQRVWVFFFIAICRNSLLLKYVSILTG